MTYEIKMYLKITVQMLNNSYYKDCKRLIILYHHYGELPTRLTNYKKKKYLLSSNLDRHNYTGSSGNTVMSE